MQAKQMAWLLRLSIQPCPWPQPCIGQLTPVLPVLVLLLAATQASLPGLDAMLRPIRQQQPGSSSSSLGRLKHWTATQ